MIESVEEEILTCTFCAYCRRACPIFLIDRWEGTSPRGRLAQALGLLKRELRPTGAFYSHLLNCSFCGYCEQECPSKVKIEEVILACRAALVERDVGIPARISKLLKSSLRDFVAPERSEEIALIPGRFAEAEEVVRLLKSTGLRVTAWEIPPTSPLLLSGHLREFEERKHRLIGELSRLEVRKAAVVDPAELFALRRAPNDFDFVHYTELLLEAGFSTATVGGEVAYLPSAFLESLSIESADQLLEKAAKVKVRLKGAGAEVGWLDEGLLERLARQRMSEASGLRVITASAEHSEELIRAGARTSSLQSFLEAAKS